MIPIIMNVTNLTSENRSINTDVALLIDVSTIKKTTIIDKRANTLLSLLAISLRMFVTLIVSFRFSANLEGH